MAQGNPTELFYVMKALEPALKSIDIRTIAITPKLESNWQNLITSVFMTEKTVDEVIEEQKNIPLLRPGINMRLYVKTCPLNNDFFGELINGQILFLTQHGREKVYFKKFDPTRLKVRSNQKKIAGTYRWILEAESTGTQGERGELWSVAGENEREAIGQGFPNIIKFIENRLGIHYSNGSQKDFNFIIPPLAAIENMHFSKTKFEVEIKKVEGLTNLQLNLSHSRDNDLISTVLIKVKERKNHS